MPDGLTAIIFSDKKDNSSLLGFKLNLMGYTTKIVDTLEDFAAELGQGERNLYVIEVNAGHKGEDLKRKDSATFRAAFELLVSTYGVPDFKEHFIFGHSHTDEALKSARDYLSELKANYTNNIYDSINPEKLFFSQDYLMQHFETGHILIPRGIPIMPIF